MDPCLGVVANGLGKSYSPFARPHSFMMAAAPANSSKSLKGIIAGGITGGIEICITFPTEYVKTQLQLDEKSGQAKRYKGLIHCVKSTVAEHGIRGLYRGLSVLLYGSIPKSAVRFGSFEEFKKRSVDEKGNLPMNKRLLCGLAKLDCGKVVELPVKIKLRESTPHPNQQLNGIKGAGVCEAILAVTPMETIKVKFINDQTSANPKFKGFFNGVKQIIKQKGIRGVYQGLTPTIMKQGSNQAMRFFVVETLKDKYRDGDPNIKVPTLLTGVFGAIAGAVSVFGNTPIDVIKTRMQGLDAEKYKNTIDCVVKVMKHEGPKAFYKGTIPRLSRVCLDVAITFMIYDSFMNFFNTVWVT